MTYRPGAGELWALEGTPPNVPRDDCTLQLIQVMDGNTIDPVDDPPWGSSCSRCAGIVLLEAGPGHGLGSPGPGGRWGWLWLR